LNELINYQPARFFALIETEKEATNIVFYLLKEKYDDVLSNPPRKK